LRSAVTTVPLNGTVLHKEAVISSRVSPYVLLVVLVARW